MAASFAQRVQLALGLWTLTIGSKVEPLRKLPLVKSRRPITERSKALRRWPVELLETETGNWRVGLKCDRFQIDPDWNRPLMGRRTIFPSARALIQERGGAREGIAAMSSATYPSIIFVTGRIHLACCNCVEAINCRIICTSRRFNQAHLA